ncbi:MAG: DNA polymerase [Thermofilaceae archaeon]|nr:DNA polymerase [Thermofilaceae archaeon]
MSVTINLRKQNSGKRIIERVNKDFRLNPRKYRFPKRGRLPRKIIFFDVETRPVKTEENLVYHEAFLIIAQYYKRIGNEYYLVNTYKFNNKTDFTRWLLGKSHAVVFAHNLDYDFRAGIDLEVIDRTGFKLSFMNFEKGKTIIRLKRGKTTLTFVDTLNYYNFSVEELGKTFGLEKLKQPEDCSDIEAWIAYCKRDVEIIAKATIFLINFMYKFGIGLKYTIPAYAFALFNLHFKDKSTYFVPTEYEKIEKLEREAYYGGRVEVYRVGEIDFQFFPSCCRTPHAIQGARRGAPWPHSNWERIESAYATAYASAGYSFQGGAACERVEDAAAPQYPGPTVV